MLKIKQKIWINEISTLLWIGTDFKRFWVKLIILNNKMQIRTNLGMLYLRESYINLKNHSGGVSFFSFSHFSIVTKYILFVFQRQSWQKYHEHKKEINAAIKIEHEEKVYCKLTFKRSLAIKLYFKNLKPKHFLLFRKRFFTFLKMILK